MTFRALSFVGSVFDMNLALKSNLSRVLGKFDIFKVKFVLRTGDATAGESSVTDITPVDTTESVEVVVAPLISRVKVDVVVPAERAGVLHLIFVY